MAERGVEERKLLDDQLDRAGYFYVDVFDCLFPIPRDYVIFSSETNGLRIHTMPSDAPVGLITIAMDKSEWKTADRASISHRSSINGLAVTQYELQARRPHDADSTRVEAAVVDDGVRYLTIYGRDASIAGALAEKCLESK